jgi:helix-turn-helix protein
MVADRNNFGYKLEMDMTNHIDGPDLAPDAVHPLVTYRKQHGLTQKDLAAQLDVARETVARWETGRRIDDGLLPMVSEHTGISRGALRPDLAKLLDEKPTAEPV